MFRVCTGYQSALHVIVKNMDERLAASSVGFLYQRFHQAGFAAVQLNQNLLTFLQTDSAVDQKFCKFTDSWIFHVFYSFQTV